MVPYHNQGGRSIEMTSNNKIVPVTRRKFNESLLKLKLKPFKLFTVTTCIIRMQLLLQVRVIPLFLLKRAPQMLSALELMAISFGQCDSLWVDYLHMGLWCAEPQADSQYIRHMTRRPFIELYRNIYSSTEISIAYYTWETSGQMATNLTNLFSKYWSIPSKKFRLYLQLQLEVQPMYSMGPWCQWWVLTFSQLEAWIFH